MISWTHRHAVGTRRLKNILRTYTIASARTLEQKISDAGPTNQRIDPHILTDARKALIQDGTLQQIQKSGIPWYFLTESDEQTVQNRLRELDRLHRQTQKPTFVMQLGQALEIATYRALHSQGTLAFFGNFPDLEAHDDSTLYSKEEPPSSLSGNSIPSGKKLDYLIHHPTSGYAGIEIKNIREWLYPDRTELREMLLKCCALDVIPVLIARRIHSQPSACLTRVV